jgi:N-ethylmaleimide reductase
MTNQLLTSFTLDGLTLKNRVVLAPMTRARAGTERTANVLMAEYYVQRANAGLIISEATAISEQSLGWVNSPGIYTDAHVAGWKIVTDAVRKTGTPIFLQLWHCGRASHSSFRVDRSLPVSASAVKVNGEYIHTPEGKLPYETPRALRTEEIAGVVADYRRAAERAKDAGFDGVEIHAANGYLIDQFLQSKTNQRTDQYGGSVDNRCRFLREVVEAVLTVWPAGRVAVRLSPNGVYNDMGSPDSRDQFLHAARQLDAYRLGYLHVMDGLAFGFHEHGQPLTLADFRAVYRGALMGNCGYTQATAEAVLKAGHVDLIAFGRPYITNPDLVARFQNGWPLAPDAPVTVWSGPTAAGYTDFPAYAATAPSLTLPGQAKTVVALGDAITYRLTGEQTDGKMFVGEVVAPPGGGPPPHKHRNEDEIFIILEGRISLFDGTKWTEVPVGTTAYLPRGGVHTYKNVGDKPARFLAITQPAGFEKFFARFAEATNAPGGHDMARAIQIAAEHGITILPP